MTTDNDTSDFSIFKFDFSDHLKINRRVGVRYPAPSAKITLRKSNLLNYGGEFSGHLLDISAKGALISCSEPLNKDTKLAIKIVFNDGTLFNLKGRVVREKSPHHYGLKFIDYNKFLDEYLYKLIS
jgi:hypothetical protein